MIKYKLLAMDLDGTAVNNAGDLGEKTRAAFKKARAQGCLICFVSGRRDVDMRTLYSQMQQVDYLILNNGGKLIDWQRGTILENECVEKADAQRLVEFCLQNSYILQIMGDHNGFWATNILSERTENYSRALGASPVKYCSFNEIPCGIEGFVAFQAGKKMLRFIEEQSLSLWGVESEPGCYDIMPANVTKWRGIARLAERLHVNSSEIITAGNYYNDVEMLEKAGIGVAVANALDVVKRAAAYVTESDNNSDAMAELIQKFVLHP